MKINPTDWHSTRQLSYCPKHFIQFDMNYGIVDIIYWLEYNTTGRYAIFNTIKQYQPNMFVSDEQCKIGFENPADATMYTLFYK